MKKLSSLVSVLALTLLTACGSDAGASIAGTYQVDKAALKEAAMAQMPEEARSNPQAAEMVGKMFDSAVMDLELKADNTCAMTVKMDMMGAKVDHTSAGTWKLDGDKLTITSTEGDTEQTQTFTIKDGKIVGEMDLGGQKQQVSMTRKKA